MPPFTTVPLRPFGCRIDNLDLRTANAADARRVGTVTATHGFTVVTGQHDLDDATFARFLERIGPAMFTEGETSVPGHPTLNPVTNVGRTRPPRSVWHTDTSYVAEPPAFTALRVLEPPSQGGETLIADQLAAYDELDVATKDRLREATVLHGATGVPDATTTRHPLFRYHPDTGRTAIFLSTPERCTALSDHDGTESKATIAELYAFGTANRFVYRHRWQAGDILLWDNRRTLHKGDHSAVVGNRTLHRGMVRGEQPRGRGKL